MAELTRRRLLAGSLAATSGAALLHSTVPHSHPWEAEAAQPHHGGDHAGGHADFRDGRTVDHAANGFDPHEIVRDFDWGTTSRLAGGRVVREWELYAVEQEIEVAPGVRFAAWSYNQRVPGPTLRCREGERLRITFINGSQHPHTIHFHGIHPAEMDGVPGLGAGQIEPRGSTVYEFDALPAGLHLYHCHVRPLAEHIAKGLYGAFIVDPKDGREDADELVRIYLVNVLEYDLINSFHLHGNLFDYYPTGTGTTPSELTDTVMLCQGQRGILEWRFPHPGKYMFHAHQSEFTELGWQGFFEVS